MNLSDRSAVTALDPHGMWDLTEGFPDQCAQALAIAEEAKLPTLAARPGLVMLTGMGGSAAGGDFVRAAFEASGTTPFLVNRDYNVPNYLGLDDLVYCASYSGNTEETLSAYAQAKKAGANVIAVTSGGKLAQRVEADGHTLIKVPGGQPPRTALGFMLLPVLVSAERLKLIGAQNYAAAFELLQRCVGAWTVEGKDSQPKQIAEALCGRIGILYGLGSWQGLIASRWKSQINENSKCHAFANSVPEMNHNEILGWDGASRQGAFTVVALTDGSETPNMKTRLRVTRQILESKSETPWFEVKARGNSLLEKMLSLALFGDFVSLYLAALNQVDPETIDSINRLKDELSRV